MLLGNKFKAVLVYFFELNVIEEIVLVSKINYIYMVLALCSWSDETELPDLELLLFCTQHSFFLTGSSESISPSTKTISLFLISIN